MPKGYWIGQVDILEPDGYAEYAKAAKVAVKAFDGRYLIRGGAHLAPEGRTRARHRRPERRRRTRRGEDA